MITPQRHTHAVLQLGAAVGPQLHRLLRERIVRNDIEPGARLSEAEIAAAYAVSRQPVREAFIKLAEEGLVEVRPQRGTFVRKIGIASVMDARFVREAVEADIVRMLAKSATDGVVEALRAEVAEQREVLSRHDRFIQLDDRFHALLAASAGKARVWSVVEGLKSQMDRVRFLSMNHAPTRKLVEQHSAIVEAIAAHDEAAAEAALRSHLREILNDLPAIAQSRPGYFTLPES